MSISVELLWSNDPLPINEIIENPTVVVNLPIGGTIITSTVTQSYVDDQDALLQTQIDAKADQVDFDQTNAQVELNRLSILTKADAADLSMLAQLVDTKADADAVNQALSLKADLVGGVIPAAQLPSGVALGETSSTAYRGDRGKIAYDHSLSQGNPHNATTSEITEGTNKYFTDLRVRNTVLSGLVKTNSSNVTNTDTIEVAVGKLATKSEAGGSVTTWVSATSIGTVHPSITQTNNFIEFAKINGMLWIRGFFKNTNVIAYESQPYFFRITDNSYKIIQKITPSSLLINIPIKSIMNVNATLGFATSGKCIDASTASTSIQYFGIMGTTLMPPSDFYYIPPTCLGELVIK